MYEDVVAPAGTPKLEAHRLDQAVRIAESHIDDVATRDSIEQPSRAHSSTVGRPLPRLRSNSVTVLALAGWQGAAQEAEQIAVQESGDGLVVVAAARKALGNRGVVLRAGES